LESVKFEKVNLTCFLVAHMVALIQQGGAKVKVAVIGASRGLGKALTDHLELNSEVSEILGVSRNPDTQMLSAKLKPFAFDLSKDLAPLLAELELFNPNRIFYLAGGGPYGRFDSQKWSAHEWSLNVTFLSAARLTHWFMSRKEQALDPQFVLIGSSIAEASADANAASYAAGKHALLGLFQSIQAERPQLDLRLYSPGYMNTEMLPAGSWPREQGQPLWEPSHVAAMIWEWAKNPLQKGSHMSLQAFAEKPKETH
jgi:short-subunit dehydrogenase